MKVQLNYVQRIYAVIIYVLLIISACYYFNQSFDFVTDTTNVYNTIFVSGALLLILGAYVAEPYFTKPVDVITNSIGLILALFSINKSNEFIGYEYLLISAFILLLSAIILVIFSSFKGGKKRQKIYYKIITNIGKSSVVFSAIYIATLFSYFRESPIEFTVFITFRFILITQFFVEYIIIFISKVYNYINNKSTISEGIGRAIGCENPLLYTIEIDHKKSSSTVSKGNLVCIETSKGTGAIGIIISEKHLLNKKRLNVHLLQNDSKLIKIKINDHSFIQENNNIYGGDNYIYRVFLSSLESSLKTKIEGDYIYKNYERFIGYVSNGSNINKINVHILAGYNDEVSSSLKEGVLLQTLIHNCETLYQVVDGNTHEEILEKNSTHGYIRAICQKLGKYNHSTSEIDTVKWMPNIYSPVFLLNQNNTQTDEELDPGMIGRLPGTELKILLKKPNALVTHNTAILGILGIGKSCLTFELIQKIVNSTDAKIVCIDVTNEYSKELLRYIPEDQIQTPSSDWKSELRANNRNGNSDDPTTRGNVEFYKDSLNQELGRFSNSDCKILILNPDWHLVSRAGSAFKITHKIDLTLAEKTRMISEHIFIKCKHEREELDQETRDRNIARYLIVYEEAHSLIPEWNSTANPGDSSASNGTSKVILQGRKFGLGSFIIAQRTANVSKSILNQCNTVFSMRIFDDTGKSFLENYIGKDYANTLPRLEERSAVVMGKALNLKQPVILELNDKSEVTLGEDSE